MKDDAERVTVTLTHRADSVAQVNPIVAAGSSDRAAVHGEHHTVALSERHHFDARLHPRPLFGQHKFTALEIFGRIGEKDRDLQRENVLAVQILVQAIVVAGTVLQ
jgi:hypothetical protein